MLRFFKLLLGFVIMALYAAPKHSLRGRPGGRQQTASALVIGLAVASVLVGVASCSKSGKPAVQREVVLQSASSRAYPWTTDLTTVALPTEGETPGPVAASGGAASPVDVSGTQPEL